MSDATTVRIPSSGMIHMPGMVRNYRYAISVKDEGFTKMFEAMLENAPLWVFKKIRDGEYTVDSEDAIVVTK